MKLMIHGAPRRVKPAEAGVLATPSSVFAGEVAPTNTRKAELFQAASGAWGAATPLMLYVSPMLPNCTRCPATTAAPAIAATPPVLKRTQAVLVVYLFLLLLSVAE